LIPGLKRLLGPAEGVICPSSSETGSNFTITGFLKLLGLGFLVVVLPFRPSLPVKMCEAGREPSRDADSLDLAREDVDAARSLSLGVKPPLFPCSHVRQRHSIFSLPTITRSAERCKSWRKRKYSSCHRYTGFFPFQLDTTI